MRRRGGVAGAAAERRGAVVVGEGARRGARLVDLRGPGGGLAGGEAFVGEGPVQAPREEACGRGSRDPGLRLRRRVGRERERRARAGEMKRTEEAQGQVQGKAPLARDGVELRRRACVHTGARRQPRRRRRDRRPWRVAAGTAQGQRRGGAAVLRRGRAAPLRRGTSWRTGRRTPARRAKASAAPFELRRVAPPRPCRRPITPSTCGGAHSGPGRGGPRLVLHRARGEDDVLDGAAELLNEPDALLGRRHGGVDEEAAVAQLHRGHPDVHDDLRRSRWEVGQVVPSGAAALEWNEERVCLSDETKRHMLVGEEAAGRRGARRAPCRAHLQDALRLLEHPNARADLATNCAAIFPRLERQAKPLIIFTVLREHGVGILLPRARRRRGSRHDSSRRR